MQDRSAQRTLLTHETLVMRLFAGTPWDAPPKCDRCGKLETECKCPPPPPERIPPEKQTAKLSVQRRSKGKEVTVIAGLSEPATDLPALLTTLKNRCGTGGTLKDDTLEIQGNQLERARAVLTEIGYHVKG
jgi:translation initiation factor 1